MTTQSLRESFLAAATPTARPHPTDAVDAERARWERPALAGLLVATALLYLWGLGASGWANSFYSAAVQAGSESWKAFFFGASDAAGSITVDKTPLSLWPMALSVRVFGLSSWSILVPQALEGVAAVALLHATVRRTTGSTGAGLLAGATLALTPVAVLMFRFNNPDAMLVLLLVASAYATLRAVDATAIAGSRPVRWLALGGALVGLAFLTKMLQAFLVLPALALVYLLFAALPLRSRLGHLLVAFGSMVLAGGWWVLIVSLWPAASRPYIGGSQHNSILELTLGYNGFGRLTGSETGSVGGGGGWGSTGILRLFGSDLGGQVAWLLPAALLLGGAALALSFPRLTRVVRLSGSSSTRSGGRPVRAGLTLWLGWLVVTGLTFSFMAGIFHAYYTVALAPAIAALVAIGAQSLWGRRGSLVVTAVLGFTTALTTVLAFVLLGRDASWLPWLRYAVAAVGLLTALLLVGVRHLPSRVGSAVAAAALVAGLAGPTAYSLATAATPHTGSIPSAGPSSGSGGGPGGGFGARIGTPPGGLAAPTGTPGATGTTGTAGTGTTGSASAGGLLTGSTSSAALTKLLQTDASSYTWAAAAVGSNSAAGYQLASQEPVMAIGGFNGSDPSPTLAQFKAWVSAGRIHYFIASGDGGGAFGGGGPSASGSTSTSISSWVEANFQATTVDGVTVYDLS